MKDAAEETTRAITNTGEKTEKSVETNTTAVNNVWKNFVSQNNSSPKYSGTTGMSSSYSDRALFCRVQ